MTVLNEEIYLVMQEKKQDKYDSSKRRRFFSYAELENQDNHDSSKRKRFSSYAELKNLYKIRMIVVNEEDVLVMQN